MAVLLTLPLRVTHGGAVTDFDQAKKRMNFGTIEIDRYGRLQAAILDIDGRTVYRQTPLPR